MGVAVDVVWTDEEPPYPIYSEAVTRTQTTDGLVMLTFTPLLGFTDVITLFLEPKEGDIPRGVVTMTIEDAEHFSDADRAKIISGYASWERDTRAYGVPMVGQGRVFPVDEADIKCDPFEIPKHFARICGIDFGIDHPASAVWVAWDRDSDTAYVYDCYKKSGETPVYHAATINLRGKWIPVSWPHDGLNKEKSSGKVLAEYYREHDVNILPFTARYDDEKGGNQDVEPVVVDMLERMRTGRFKVFSHLNDWFDECRMYHRKDGKIVPLRDDIMAGTRYAMMMLRYARPEILPALRTTTQRGLRMAG
jgi:phage terminase large subunit-like protein